MAFNEVIPKFTTATRSHADNFNDVNSRLLENDKYLKQEIENNKFQQENDKAYLEDGIMLKLSNEEFLEEKALLDNQIAQLQTTDAALQTDINKRVLTETYTVDKAALEKSIADNAQTINKTITDNVTTLNQSITDNVKVLNDKNTSQDLEINKRVLAETYATDKSALERSIAEKTTTSLNGAQTNVNFIEEEGGVKSIEVIDTEGAKKSIFLGTDYVDKVSNSINQFDKESKNIIQGKWMNMDGTLTDNDSYIVSDFIHVPQGYMAVCTFSSDNGISRNQNNANGFRFICAFDANKNIVNNGKANDSGSNESVNAWYNNNGEDRYIRFSINNVLRTDIMVEVIKSNIPYNGVVGFSRYVPFETKLELKNEVESTSPYLDDKTMYRLDADSLILDFTLKSLTDKIFLIRKLSSSSRVYFVDFSKNRMGLCQSITDTGTLPTYTETSGIDISFPITNNVPYTIKSEKYKGKYFRLTLVNRYTLEETVFEDTLYQGSGQGIRTYMISGQSTVNNFTVLTNQPQNPKLLIIGDSFVDGNQIWNEKDDRYCALIREKLNNDCFIAGWAGGTSEDAITLFNYVKKATRPKYAILAFGTNDNDYTKWQRNMLYLISEVEKIGAKPILVTITRRGDFDNSGFIAAANNWIRNSGYLYADLNIISTLNNDGVSFNAALFEGDKIHPSVKCNWLMYKRFLVDVPELFN